MNDIENLIKYVEGHSNNFLGSKTTLKEKETFEYMYDLLVETLEKQLTNGWIPCIEKYPEECERVIVWDSLNNRIAIAYFSCPHWEADDGRINVIAWQPLPEPYKKVSDAEKN